MRSKLYSSKIAVNISRYLMAALFIFSGVAKSINPFGLSNQVGDYLVAMGLSALTPLSSIAGVMLPSVELLLGLMILMAIGRRVAAWGVILSMSFFTLLTLWIAIENPVSDCGCFGDLLKLTNWETFLKNIVLLPFAIVLFAAWRKAECSGAICIRRTVAKFALAIPASFALALYSNSTLPLIDATPFKIGVNIPEAMQPPANSSFEQHTILLYKEIVTGKVREFEIEDTTWYDDSKWEFVDSRTTSTGESSSPAISSLPIISADGDISKDLLDRDGYLAMIVVPLVEKITISELESLQKFTTFTQQRGVQTIVLTASSIGQASDRLKSLLDLDTQVFGSDYTVLKTMIQNHRGGVMLLLDGTIVGKWSMNNLPHEF